MCAQQQIPTDLIVAAQSCVWILSKRNCNCCLSPRVRIEISYSSAALLFAILIAPLCCPKFVGSILCCSQQLYLICSSCHLMFFFWALLCCCCCVKIRWLLRNSFSGLRYCSIFTLGFTSLGTSHVTYKHMLHFLCFHDDMWAPS